MSSVQRGAQHIGVFCQEGKGRGGISKRWQEWKQLEGEDICCLLTTAAVAEHLLPEGCTMPTGTCINYLLLDPVVDISPAGPPSMGPLALGGQERVPEGGLETALFLDTQADFEYWFGLDFGAQMIWRKFLYLFMLLACNAIPS